MRAKRWTAAAGAVLLAFSMTACGGDDGGVDVEVQENPEFPAGSTMAELSEQGSIVVGVKLDQPGIGFQEPGADEPTGFDIEIAKIIAAELGIAPDDIEWKEAVSANREPFIQNGTVDMVAASYSITDERKKLVSFAGPYYVTGQQLLVSADDDSITGPDTLEGKKVCSVEGSTSIATVEEEYGAEPVPFKTYQECVNQLLNGSVDAVTTDGAILLGYAAQNPDELKVVGDAFSEERYGIGFKKDDTEFCQFIVDTLEAAYEDGTWREAFDATLGEAGVEAPEPPQPDECA